MSVQEERDCVLGIDFGSTTLRASLFPCDQIDVNKHDCIHVEDFEYPSRRDFQKDPHSQHEFPTIGLFQNDDDSDDLVGHRVFKVPYDVRDLILLKPAMYAAAGRLDDALSEYPPIQNLIDGGVLQDDLRSLITRFFEQIKRQIDDFCARRKLKYSKLAFSIPGQWGQEPFITVQHAYRIILYDVWDQIYYDDIEFVLETEALAHTLITRYQDHMRQFGRVMILDMGGHTIATQSFAINWSTSEAEQAKLEVEAETEAEAAPATDGEDGSAADSNDYISPSEPPPEPSHWKKSRPRFNEVSTGSSRFAGGEYMFYLLSELVRSQAEASGILDPDTMSMLLDDLRAQINGRVRGVDPWKEDSLLVTRTLPLHAVKVRVEDVRECFELAFGPCFEDIGRQLQEAPKATLLVVYGGSALHEYTRKRLIDLAKKNPHHTKIMINSRDSEIHLSTRACTERWNDARAKKRAKPTGNQIYHTMAFASCFFSHDITMAISEGAALAVARKMTVLEFLERGAAFGIHVDPSSRVDIVLRDFPQAIRKIRNRSNNPELAMVRASKEITVSVPYTHMPKDGDIESWDFFSDVQIVCDSVDSGRRQTNIDHTYQLYAVDIPLQSGTYLIEMACDLETLRLSVSFTNLDPDSSSAGTRLMLELFSDAGSNCVRAEHVDPVENGESRGFQNKTRAKRRAKKKVKRKARDCEQGGASSAAQTDKASGNQPVHVAGDKRKRDQELDSTSPARGSSSGSGCQPLVTGL